MPSSSPGDARPEPRLLTPRAPAPACGDGQTDPGEDCEPPGATAACAELLGGASETPALVTCTADCLWQTSACFAGECGDGRQQLGELCDDGNELDGDGCSASCLIEVADGEVFYDGPLVDARIERARAASVCRDPSIRAERRRAGRLAYELIVCRLPGGEPVYPLARIRAALAEGRRAFSPAVELFEAAAAVEPFGAACRVPFGAPELRQRAAAAHRAGRLPLFFVAGIDGSDVPGANAHGFGGFGYGAVLATTRADVVTHELGHVFGLLHTHACLDTGEAVCPGDGLCDTPYDPGPSWLPHTCADRPAERCDPTCGMGTCSGGASPDRSNYMGYYQGCRGHFSDEQLDLIRCVVDRDLFPSPDRACGTELCNGVDDDCDGQVDEDACTPECRAAEPLAVGVTRGSTFGRGEAYGGGDYPEGTPDLLYELRPSRAGRYCLRVDGEPTPGPILAQRDGCDWDARILASNWDSDAQRLEPTLEVDASPSEPAQISVDGWGRSRGVRFGLRVTEGPCSPVAERLSAPRLVSPSSGARTAERPVELRWEPVTGAEAYELRLCDRDAGLRSDPAGAGCDAQIIDTTAVSVHGLPGRRLLFWTVRALRGQEAGPFATPRHVQLEPSPDEPDLTAPRLLTPADDAHLPTLTERFAWEPVEGALTYEVRIGLDARTLTAESCEECISLRADGAEIQPTPLVLGPDIDFLWTVRAARPGERGPFANPHRFAIEDWVCTRVGRLEPPASQLATLAPDGADDLVASCGGTSSAEHVWLMVAPRAGTYCVDTEGSELDTVISVRRRCEAPETEIACNDEQFDGAGASRVTFAAAAEEPLFIVVEGYDSTAAGAYALHVNEGPCN